VALAVVALVTTPPWSAVEAPQGGVYVVVSGSTLVAPGAKLLLIYADGSRERIKVIWVSKPIRAGFYYHVIPSAHRTHARRPIALELKRGTRIVARQVLQTPPRGH